MSKVQATIEDLQAHGYSDCDLLAALQDGEALSKIGLGDEDQDDIETAYNRIFDRVHPEIAVSDARERSAEMTDEELEDLRAGRSEANIRYSIKGDL